MRYRQSKEQEADQVFPLNTELDQSLSMLSQTSGEEWILSYADVVTLLLCFFIMFVHFREVEAIKNPQKKKSQLVESAPRIPVPTASVEASPIKDRPVEEATAFGPDMQKIFGSLNERLTQLNIGEHKLGKNGLVIYLNEGVFDFGKFEARPGVLEKLTQLAEMIRPDVHKLQIEIQGYSDATPVRPSSRSAYKSNLELSILRSLSILRKFVEQGLPESSMAVTGFGEYKQIKTDSSLNEDVLSKNRRISIRILPKDS